MKFLSPPGRKYSDWNGQLFSKGWTGPLLWHQHESCCSLPSSSTFSLAVVWMQKLSLLPSPFSMLSLTHSLLNFHMLLGWWEKALLQQKESKTFFCYQRKDPSFRIHPKRDPSLSPTSMPSGTRLVFSFVTFSLFFFLFSLFSSFSLLTIICTNGSHLSDWYLFMTHSLSSSTSFTTFVHTLSSSSPSLHVLISSFSSFLQLLPYFFSNFLSFPYFSPTSSFSYFFYPYFYCSRFKRRVWRTWTLKWIQENFS